LTLKNYLEIAVAAPLYHTLTYARPKDCDQELVPGLRLLVPLANRQVTGYLLGVADSPPDALADALATGPAGGKGTVIRPAIDVLDAAPLFPEAMVPFFRWIADYYRHPIGEVIRTALPGGLTTRSGRRITLSPEGRRPLEQAGERGAEKYRRVLPYLEQLLERGELSPATARVIWRTSLRNLFLKWQEAGWIDIVAELLEDRTGARTECCVEPLDPEPAGEGELKKSETRTLELLAALVTGTGRSRVPRRELTRLYSGAGQALKSLAARGLVRLSEQRVHRDPFGRLPPFFPAPELLTTEQRTALEQLTPAIDRRGFATFLLHGVTGSGKTEVYLRAAARTLEGGRSVLILVPEIALATQLEGHFLSRFGDRVALLHSGLSAGERFDQWCRIMRGEADVVIGARSAVFAPLVDPGLIVVDEEHDSAYKQDDGLRYHGRDLAILRGSRQQCVVLLGSATPSVTSYYHAGRSKYHLLTLAHRIENRPLPTMEIVDLRGVPTVSGYPPLFSSQLARALRANLDKGQQSLVFLNRRGYANLMICRECGHTVRCRHCHISLTMHRGRKELLCHYCGYTVPLALACPNCRSTTGLTGIGFGTERLESELAAIFPKARLARLDRDTCATRNGFLKILQAMHDGEVDILVGTQMIAKGHHFPKVTLVGIVMADAGLGLPDFRASERTFQVIAQVTGRAGRGDERGRVIVQTLQPDHYVIAMAKEHDYRALFEREIALRRAFGYPPFRRLINLKLEGEDEEKVSRAALTLAALARELCAGTSPAGAVEAQGPAPAPLRRLHGRYRWHLLLLGREVRHLHEVCAALLQQAPARLAPGVTIAADVDPENML